VLQNIGLVRVVPKSAGAQGTKVPVRGGQLVRGQDSAYRGKGNILRAWWSTEGTQKRGTVLI